MVELINCTLKSCPLQLYKESYFSFIFEVEKIINVTITLFLKFLIFYKFQSQSLLMQSKKNIYIYIHLKKNYLFQSWCEKIEILISNSINF